VASVPSWDSAAAPVELDGTGLAWRIIGRFLLAHQGRAPGDGEEKRRKEETDVAVRNHKQPLEKRRRREKRGIGGEKR
jgi:hypothetical protein